MRNKFPVLQEGKDLAVNIEKTMQISREYIYQTRLVS